MHSHPSTTSSLRKITLGLILVVVLMAFPIFYYKREILIVSTLLSVCIIIYTWVTIRNDISRRIRLEKEFMEKNAALNKFFSIISHDLRNPIHGIAKLAAYLDGTTSPEETAEMGKAIKDTAIGAGELLEKVLLWARTQSDNYHLKIELLDITSLISASIESLATAAALKNITINYKTENHLVIADKELVTFVLKNSIENAIKYSQENSVVTILTENGNSEIKIKVVDHGIGMSEELHHNAFSIEHANSRKGTKGEKGFGISLPLCKDFIELIGGKISLRSIEDKGTEFHFTLRKPKNL